MKLLSEALFLAALLALGQGVASAAGPVASWAFSAEEETPLLAHGGVHRDVPGPRPPDYPDFAPDNTAVKFAGSGAYFSFADPGVKSLFDFANGDEITIEAWVDVDDLREGENLYIIGKGRTGTAGFARDNQNWALRIRGIKGNACVSFLFATPPAAGVARSDAHWHRWTTKDGFAPKSGWHHIAASYRFGQPESVRGWIDGKSLPGSWDMGGPTAEEPVVDDDAIWIGSSQGGHAGNSFHGTLDNVAIHRAILDEQALASRYRRVGDPVVDEPAPEVMPDVGPLPAGRVLVTFHEGMPAHDRWLMTSERVPSAVQSWQGEEFLLPRLPVRYDAWGIRESWKTPVLVRMAAEVALEPGRHVLLLRARGQSRLWLDGKIVARTKPLTGSPNGEEPITPVAEPPLPGLRPAGHRLQETVAEVDVRLPGRLRVVLEAMAGGKAFRAEPGELTVAVRTSDGESFVLLQPAGTSARAVPMTDVAVNAAIERIGTSLTELDDQTRRSVAASRDAFWQHRHDLARDWAGQHPSAAPPQDTKPSHPIDAFLAVKIRQAEAEAAKSSPEEAGKFHATVLPILRSECFRCHGDKDRGGLRLNSRAAALKGGDSETPAIVPGNAAASPLMARIRHENPDERMPPTGKGLTAEQITTLEKWINAGAAWPALPLKPEQTTLAPPVNDAAFLRRVHLDTVGVVPTETEARAFLADQSPDKRERLIDRLLDDPRWADHWISYWQDLLAENPTLINATLNSTGPFRWFLYDSLRDDKPLDRMITELVLMLGSPHDGGSAGFGLAAQNDAPLAAKGHVLASALLGIELQCARCHDSPYHSTTQRDLYSLAAMLQRKTVTVPKTSSVPAAFFEKKNRESLIKVTLKPGEAIQPVWPFAGVTGVRDDGSLTSLLEHADDTRERLAALITAPQNTRFAQVVVNRVWRRLMGAGLVEPAHDWEGHPASHPELLDWLAREFITHDYSVKHVARLVLTSQAYGREASGHNLEAGPEVRFFNMPERRRMTAEQIVDSFFAAAGQPIDIEELTLDPDGRRPASNRQAFGQVERAWMLVSLSNERDRPSLTLPRAAVVCDVLESFGWSAARQTPRTDRETAPNVLQPGVIANSSLTVWLTRAAEGSSLANLAVNASTPDAIVESVFLRFLSRLPTTEERALFVDALNDGFAARLIPADQRQPAAAATRLPRVTWSNHLRSEANTIQQEWERRARLGPPPDTRLRSDWREVYEDMVWSVVNLRDFVWMP